jgi:hypothetical protein
MTSCSGPRRHGGRFPPTPGTVVRDDAGFTFFNGEGRHRRPRLRELHLPRAKLRREGFRLRPQPPGRRDDKMTELNRGHARIRPHFFGFDFRGERQPTDDHGRKSEKWSAEAACRGAPVRERRPGPRSQESGTR